VRASAACGKAMPPPGRRALDSHVGDMPKVSRLFLDIMALALACGVTRVVSMMWGGGESDENVDFMGIKDWHITTHANPAGPRATRSSRCRYYLAGEYAYFIGAHEGFCDGPARCSTAPWPSGEPRTATPTRPTSRRKTTTATTPPSCWPAGAAAPSDRAG
jgi:hypothetical protein